MTFSQEAAVRGNEFWFESASSKVSGRLLLRTAVVCLWRAQSSSSLSLTYSQCGAECRAVTDNACTNWPQSSPIHVSAPRRRRVAAGDGFLQSAERRANARRVLVTGGGPTCPKKKIKRIDCCLRNSSKSKSSSYRYSFEVTSTHPCY